MNIIYLNDQVLRYKSQSLGFEWRIFEPISVERFSLGMLEHWNHLNGTIGKGSVDGPLTKIAINLMQRGLENERQKGKAGQASHKTGNKKGQYLLK